MHLGKSQFKVAELYGKRVNWVDETGDKPIPDFDKIKMLVTGGYVTIEKKGKRFYGKTRSSAMASNFFPNIREEGNQVNRRLEIIPFDYNFDKRPEQTGWHCCWEFGKDGLFSAISIETGYWGYVSLDCQWG